MVLPSKEEHPMGNNLVVNLDLLCAKWGRDVAQMSGCNVGKKKAVLSALSVLEGQGVYAMFLFVEAKHGGTGLGSVLKNFLSEVPGIDFFHKKDGEKETRKSDTDLLSSIGEIGEDLDRLWLARDLLRQVLIYAKYHLQAMPKDDGRS